MITLATEKDFDRVHYILSHESVYPYISDDYCPSVPDKDLGKAFLESPYIAVLIPNEFTVFVLIPISTNVYHVHTSILPEGRGLKAIKVGRLSAIWMFENTKCMNIISFTPSFNKPALKYSDLVGFKRIGVIPKSFKKNGIFYDQIITGIGKGELQCQW